MQANRNRDTKPELRLRSILHSRGFRFYVCRRPLPEVRWTADIVFPRLKLAVFVDGCFWHQCPEHYRRPRRNTEYWVPKIEKNVARDREFDRLLAEAGWVVVRGWSHDDPERLARRVERQIRAQRSRYSR